MGGKTILFLARWQLGDLPATQTATTGPRNVANQAHAHESIESTCLSLSSGNEKNGAWNCKCVGYAMRIQVSAQMVYHH